MRDVTLEGLWWLPSDPDNKIAGTVSFTGETRPTLRLIGAFTHAEEISAESYEITVPEKHPLIHGLCEQHEMTLIDCDLGGGGFRRTSSRQWRQSLQARLMLVGIWLDQADQACFDRIIIGVDHLLAWSGHTGFISEDGDSTRITYQWEPPQPFVAQIEKTSVRISLGWKTGGKSWADRNEQSIQESAGFVVNVPELRSAHALIREWAKPLQDLLTFTTGRACGIHEITLRAPRPNSDSDEVAPVQRRPAEVNAYLQPIYQSPRDEPAAIPERMLFTLRHIPFSDVLPAWLAVSKRLSPVPDMAFGLSYISHSYTENRLITAVAAAEALHRRLLPDETYVSEKKFDKLRTAVLCSIPKKHRPWLDARLWNEPTLKQRLMRLVDQLGTELVAPFMPKPNRWATAAKDARNSLVHRFPHPPPPTGEGMYVLAQMTSAIITLNLLREVGIPESRLTVIVRSFEPFLWIAEEGPKLMPYLFPAHS